MKLENIFLAADGSVRVGDFGLTMSKMQELAISPVGTVEYMAPEARPHIRMSMHGVYCAGLGLRTSAMHIRLHAAVPGKHCEPEHAGVPACSGWATADAGVHVPVWPTM